MVRFVVRWQFICQALGTVARSKAVRHCLVGSKSPVENSTQVESIHNTKFVHSIKTMKFGNSLQFPYNIQQHLDFCFPTAAKRLLRTDISYSHIYAVHRLCCFNTSQKALDKG